MFYLGGFNSLVDEDGDGIDDVVARKSWHDAKDFCESLQINSRNQFLSDDPDDADFNENEERDLDQILLVMQLSG